MTDPRSQILIVDDDRAICDYMQTLLESDGFAVKTMNDPTSIDVQMVDSEGNNIDDGVVKTVVL